MTLRGGSDNPEMDALRTRFEHWRQTRGREGPIPPELWAAAVAHGTFVHVSVLRQINSAAYNFSVLIWLAYTAFAPARNRVATAARSKDWNYALEDARVQPAEDSLLDTMDRTVERLLYPPPDSRVTVAGAGLSSGSR